MARIHVLGAGVVGLATAYALARRGHAVNVIDAGAGPAEAGASFGNGGQLSYAYTDALASPALLRSLPKYLLGFDAAFRLRPSLRPAFWRWSLSLLANATAPAFRHNTLEALRLAMESRDAFAEIAPKIAFDHRRCGKLHLYAAAPALNAARVLAELKNGYGAGQEILTPAQAIEREPALAAYRGRFVGALWSPYDEAGDSLLFCRDLRRLLEADYGVDFKFGTRVKALRAERGALVSLLTTEGEIPCQTSVLTLGVGSVAVARTAGIALPIWPLQGYSLTVPATDGAPAVSITDTARKLVLCRLGTRLRAAGLADLGPREAPFRPARFAALLASVRDAFPEAGDYAAPPEAWTGQRPMSPTSRPIIGPSQLGGLYLNCGHGSLGWTLSMGSAERIAGLVTG